MKSFVLFWRAIKSTRHEMWVSVQVLVAVTLILSLLLYLVEHHAQPEVFHSYWDALLWSFMGYIDDPGEFATYTPITFWGRVLKIACAIVNIAIFAVPAGLVAGGFSEAIAEDKRQRELDEYQARLRKAFRRRQDRHTKFRVVPRYISPVDVQAIQEMDTKDIIDAVRNSQDFRLRNLASAVPPDRNPQDRLVIETIPAEGRTPYGCCIDRKSPVTIVAPTAANEVAIGNFAYYLALFGGFNYISKERDLDSDAPRSYYLLPDSPDQAESRYLDDIRRLSRGGWVIFLIAADSVHPEAFHFVTAIQPRLSAGASTVADTARFDTLYARVAETMQRDYGLSSERDTRYLPVGKKNVAMRIGAPGECNAFTLRIDWAIPAFDLRHTAIALTLASEIAEALESRSLAPAPEWKDAAIGY